MEKTCTRLRAAINPLGQPDCASEGHRTEQIWIGETGILGSVICTQCGQQWAAEQPDAQFPTA